MKLLFTSILLFLYLNLTIGQCACDDCPEPIIANTPTFANANISGSTNPILGENGQALCQVCLSFRHMAVIELSMRLVAPNGSFVDLMIGEPISCHQNVFFDICFVPCNQPANPDPGYSPIWVSNQNWFPGPHFGTYHPESGCLETDLTGSINGTWTMELNDAVIACDGELFNFTLHFSDGAGLNCQTGDGCAIPPQCMAEGGEIPTDYIYECEGSQNLVLDLPPTFPPGEEPPADYNYIYLVTVGNFIHSYLSVPDFSGYPVGVYQVCGLSVLASDQSLLPGGQNLVQLLYSGIAQGIYCADITDQCFQLTILPSFTLDFIGESTVCSGYPYIYTITDFDPDFEDYFVNITSGIFEEFTSLGNGQYQVTWSEASSSGTICASAVSNCGNIEQCIDVMISTQADVAIEGDFQACAFSTNSYTITPLPGVNEQYILSITGAISYTLSGNEVTVQWDNSEPGEICVKLQDINSLCEGEETCFEVDIINNVFPQITTNDVCLNSNEIYFADPLSPHILTYNWTVTNATIIFSNFEQVSIYFDNLGLVSICLDVITECGPMGPQCFELNVIENPNPSFQVNGPICIGIPFELISVSSSGNTYLWSSPNPNVVFSNPTAQNTYVTILTEGSYTIQFTETIDIGTNSCTGSTSQIIEVQPSPEITNTFFECIQFNEYYTIIIEILDENGPFTVNGNQLFGNTYTSMLIPSGGNYNITITNAEGCSTEINGNYSCPCSTFAGNMEPNLLEYCINQNPSVSISIPIDLESDGNDIGCFYLHDNNNDPIPNVLMSNCSGDFQYDPNILQPNTIYYISYALGNSDNNGFLDLTDPCLSINFGQPIIFYDSPIVDGGPDLETCDLSIELPPIDIQSENWTVAIKPPFSTATIDIVNGVVTAQVSEPGIYTFQLELINGICSSTDSIQVTFNDFPVVTPPNFICEDGGFIVQFNISGGTAPYTVNGNLVTSLPFESQIYSSGTVVSFIIEDDKGCQNQNAIGGTINCNCTTKAGTMSSDTLKVCGIIGNTFEATHNGDAIFDFDDTSIYILHTGSFNVLGTILDQNTTGVFEFVDYNYNQTYYISYVVGNEVNDTVDLTDECLSVAFGQPVVFYKKPVVSINQNPNLCSWNFLLEAENDGFNGQWTIIEAPSNATVNISDTLKPQSNFSTDIEGSYKFRWTSFNGPCSSFDEIAFELKNPMRLIETISICDSLRENYYLNITISGGSQPYYFNGEEVGNLFISPLISSNSVYNYVVEDSLGCQLEIMGLFNCACENDAGTMEQTLVNLCEGEDLSTNFSLGDSIVDDEFEVRFILHTSNNTNIGQIIAISSGASIQYNGNIVLGQIYYLSLVVGPIDMNGDLILLDPCTSVARGTPVLWHPHVNLTIADSKACESEGGKSNLSFIYNGEYPLEINLIDDQSNEVSITLIDANSIFEVEITKNTTFQIININQNCYQPTDIDFTIEYIEKLNIVLKENTICNNPIFGSELTFAEIMVNPGVVGSWQSEVGVISTEGIDYTNVQAGTYSVTFFPHILPGDCPEDSVNIYITVEDCICPKVKLKSDTTLCNLGEFIDLSSLLTTEDFGDFWTLKSPPNLSNPAIIEQGFLIINNVDPSTYLIIYTPNFGSLPEECQISDSINITLDAFNKINITRDSIGICYNETGTIDLNTLIENSDNSPIIYDESLIRISSTIIDYNLLLPGTTTYYIINENLNSCPPDTASIYLIKYDSLDVEILPFDISCFNENDGGIIIVLPSNINPTIRLNDKNIKDDSELINLSPGIYFLDIEDNQNCVFKFENILISQPEPIEVSLGNNREITANDSITITAITNLLFGDILNITWETLKETLTEKQLSILRSFSQNDQIKVTIVDEGGCIGFDIINIYVKEIDLVFPNILKTNSFENAIFKINNISGIKIVNSFQVFDRWGNLVYVQKDVLPEELIWNGKFNGITEVNQDVYVFVLQLTTINDTKKTYYGDITVIR